MTFVLIKLLVFYYINNSCSLFEHWDFHTVGKEEFQNFEGVSEASRGGKRPKREATNNERDETNATLG